MANSNPSPNMGLPIPVVGQDPGPDWSNNLNASLTILDGHSHVPGLGVPITPQGLNMNSDLSMLSNNLILSRSVRFVSESAVLSGTADVGCVYVVGNELYYNDVTGGHQIAITSNGSVNAAAGSISGLPSGSASASFSSGTFVFQSSTNTAANLDGRSLVLRNSSASSFGLTLNPPSAMGANISQTLPAIPLATNLMSMDTSGNMSAVINVDNSSLQLTSNTLSVKNLGVTAAMIANATITTTQISASAGILGSQLSTTAGIVGTQISASAAIRPSSLAAGWFAQSSGPTSGSVSSTSLTVVAGFDAVQVSGAAFVTGRPVFITITGGNFSITGPYVATFELDYNIGVSDVAICQFTMTGTAATNPAVPSGAINCFYVPTVTTNKIRLYVSISNAAGSINYSNATLTAVQL